MADTEVFPKDFFKNEDSPRIKFTSKNKFLIAFTP